MQSKISFNAKLCASIVVILVFVCGIFNEASAQQFPIGTYWVHSNNQERFDQYDQVKDCGIDIIVGGDYGTTRLPDILNGAEAGQITMIIDRIRPNTVDSIWWYAGGHGSRNNDDAVRAYSMEYENERETMS